MRLAGGDRGIWRVGGRLGCKRRWRGSRLDTVWWWLVLGLGLVGLWGGHLEKGYGMGLRWM